MKKTILGVFAASILSMSSEAHALANWHAVLSCDSGAVVVDNRDTYSVGRATLPATTAQIVIRNYQVVQYFSSALSTNSETGDGYKVVDSQWIASLAPQSTYSAGALITSFVVWGVYGAKVSVNYNGSELTVSAVSNQSQTANWIFHNCVRL